MGRPRSAQLNRWGNRRCYSAQIPWGSAKGWRIRALGRLRPAATDEAMQILQATRVTEELVSTLGRLVPQLDAAAPPPEPEHLERVLSTSGCALLVARDDSLGPGILGALTLVWYPIPTGIRARIEDMVVDPESRGRGIGEALVRAALERARQEGALGVDLTSRPSREAANRLYLRVGFKLRDTNTYRFHFDDASG